MIIKIGFSPSSLHLSTPAHNILYSISNSVDARRGAWLSTPGPTRVVDAAKLSPSEGKCTVSEQAGSGLTSPGVLLSSSSSPQRRLVVNEGGGAKGTAGGEDRNERRSLHDSLNLERSLLGRRRVWNARGI